MITKRCTWLLLLDTKRKGTCSSLYHHSSTHEHRGHICDLPQRYGPPASESQQPHRCQGPKHKAIPNTTTLREGVKVASTIIRQRSSRERLGHESNLAIDSHKIEVGVVVGLLRRPRKLKGTYTMQAWERRISTFGRRLEGIADGLWCGQASAITCAWDADVKGRRGSTFRVASGRRTRSGRAGAAKIGTWGFRSAVIDNVVQIDFTAGK